jgi:hypothetical protein
MENDSKKNGHSRPEGYLCMRSLHETAYIMVPRQVTVSRLARLLSNKFFQPYSQPIFAELTEMGLCKNENEVLDFEIISNVATRHGLIAKKNE